jgi:hypothetical protein
MFDALGRITESRYNNQSERIGRRPNDTHDEFAQPMKTSGGLLY